MDMNNPQMQAMAQAMMADPEVMQMMQQPGMMEKLQGAMSNPASAMGDPDVMRIIMKLQGMGMGGGGGGMGGMGGMGAGGANPWSSAPAAGSAGSAGSDGIRHLTTSSELSSLLSSSGSKLVVVDYFTTWCGPCKAIAPLFSELASRYKDAVVFVKVDGDRARDLVREQGVSGFPTFHFYVSGSKVDEFSGANESKLRSLVEEYGEAASAPPPCPYKHFPLRESEAVKYADIKWEMVQPKFREIAARVAQGEQPLLDESDLAAIDSMIGVLKERQNYHSTTITPAQLSAVGKMVRGAAWPVEGLGPLANLVRIAVLHPSAAKFWSDESGKRGESDLVAPLLRQAHRSDKHVAPMLVVRALANGFARRALAKALAARYEEVLESVAALYKKFDDENFRLSCVALYINYAILLSEDAAHYQQAKVLLLTSVQEALQQRPLSAKLVYRLAVILGTLLYGDAEACELARDLDVLDGVADAAAAPECKDDAPVQQVAAEITQLLKK